MTGVFTVRLSTNYPSSHSNLTQREAGQENQHTITRWSPITHIVAHVNQLKIAPTDFRLYNMAFFKALSLFLPYFFFLSPSSIYFFHQHLFFLSPSPGFDRIRFTISSPPAFFTGVSLKVILGISDYLSVTISTMFAVAYTISGGLYSVSYTDVLQLIFIVFGLVSERLDLLET